MKQRENFGCERDIFLMRQLYVKVRMINKQTKSKSKSKRKREKEIERGERKEEEERE